MREKEEDGPPCPSCGACCIEHEAAVVCPRCGFMDIKEEQWQGAVHACPKCGNDAKVFKSGKCGKVLVCEECNTITRFLDEESLKAKVYAKDSSMGRKLTWLFEVPCKNWHKKEFVEKEVCPVCSMKEVCDEHSREIDRFINKHKVEVYISADFIELVHV